MSTLDVILFVLMLVGAYLLGAVPFALVIGKLFFGVDVRAHGSGNVGTTNAFRVLGTRAGIAVLACDMLKGYVPALLATLVFGPWPAIFIAAAPVAGHMYSVFLRGSGGKGVATGSGVVLALAPKIYFTILLVWIAMVLVSRMVSLASLTATATLVVLVVLTGQPVPYVIAAGVVLVLIVYAHRANIDRMLHHREPRVSLPWERRSGATGDGQGREGG